MSQSITGRGAITLRVGGEVFSIWTRCEVTRDLADISGSFVFDYDDGRRYAALLPKPDLTAAANALLPGPPVRIDVDGEPVLLGYLDDINLDLGPDELRASVLGRDPTGDLVDCSANPTGPAEYRNLTLTDFVAKLCAPFGITVRAEVDVGDPFPLISLDVAERVMAAIERQARQRGILVVSDGVGGLVLTQSGQTRGPAPLVLGQSIHRSRVRMSWRGRFSDHWVKGQLPRVHGARRTHQAKVALDASTAPLGTGAPLAPPPATGGPSAVRKHAKGAGKHGPIYQTGHATDPGVTRYRPIVHHTRSQAGLDTVDEQAAWRARVSIASAQDASYTVVGWRAGPANQLWRPNQLVAVTDPVAGLFGVDQVIAGVRYLDGEDGQRTVLRVVDPDALTLDEEDVAPRHAGRSTPPRRRATDATTKKFR